MVDFSKHIRGSLPEKPKTFGVRAVRGRDGESVRILTCHLYIKDAPEESKKLGLPNKILQMADGVTGYESFYLDADVVADCAERGWLACSGTYGRWDSLFVWPAEMRKAFEFFDLWRQDV